jgi:fucose 4-O-acetylase-like acetyltransferase
MSPRLTGFDIVKAAAIGFVVFGHVWRGLDSAGMIADKLLFARVDAAIYLFHMPVFFFLSGLFFSANSPFTAFLRNRLLLLLWPMVLWGWVDAGLKSAARIPVEGHVYTPLEVFLSALPPVGIFWFLYTLFILHMIAWGLARLPRGGQLLAMAALAIAARTGWINVAPFDSLWNSVIFLPPFFAGIAVAMLAGRGALIGRSCAIAGAAAFFAGEAMLLSGLLPASQLGQTPAMALATLGFVLLVANLPLGDWATARLSALGQLTMPIYLTHVIFSAAVRMVLARLGQDGLFVHLIIGTLAGLAGPLLLVWLARRVGVSALLGFETARSKRS